VSDSVQQDAKTPPVVIGDEESVAYMPGVAQVSRALAADHTLAARYTSANRLVAGDDLAPDRIVPSPLDPRVGPEVAMAVAAAAAES
jgi:malic enzyme